MMRSLRRKPGTSTEKTLFKSTKKKKDHHPNQLLGWRPDHPRGTPGMRDPRTLGSLSYGYE
jgi:hypothetical protein